jgi:predicted amidohydrolase YtcJ
VVDLEGRTVMPGLIDCHVHLAPWALRLVGHPDQRLTELAAEAVRALRTTLEGPAAWDVLDSTGGSR